MNNDKEFLSHVLKNTNYLSKAISTGFKAYYLDFSNSGFSAVRSLYTHSVDFYFKYKIALDREHLEAFLNLKSLSVAEKKSIMVLFEEILSIAPVQNFDFLCDLICDAYAKNVLQRKLDLGTDMLVKNDVAKALNVIKEGIFSAENIINRSTEEGDIKESVRDRVTDYKNIKKKITAAGITTGFPKFDSCTGGMKPGELIIIMAGSREGKSTWMLNVDHHVRTKLHKNILHVSLENPRKQWERRYDARHAGVSCTKLRDGTLTAEEENLLKKAYAEDEASNSVLYVWDQPACSPQQIAAKMHELESKYKFDLVVVDYLGLLTTDTPKKEKGWQEIGDIAMGLRAIARSFKIPVLTASQVNRAGMKSQKTAYDMSDAALSFMLMFHADTVLSMKVQNPDVLKTGLGVCELNASIVKCRDGQEGEFVIDANFDRMLMQERTNVI